MMAIRMANNAKVVTKNRLESFETYNNPKSIGGKTKHDPKSGCIKINTIGRKNAASTLIMVLREALNRVTLDLERIAAAKMRVPILAESEGWTEKILRLSQRRAP